MRYNNEGEPILRRLTVNSPFRLVYETFCVLGIDYEWNRNYGCSYILHDHTGQYDEFGIYKSTRTSHPFDEFGELIEYVNCIMEERGYIKPIERI